MDQPIQVNQNEMAKNIGEALGRAVGDALGTSIKATETRTEMKKDIEFIRGEVVEMKNMMKDNFVTKDQFVPVRNLVYGMTGFILISFLGGVVALVINNAN